MISIELKTHINAPIERCFDLSRSIELHLLGTEKTGETAVAGVTSGLMKMGDFVRWRATHLGVRQHLTSKITAFDRPAYFQDTMTDGAFKFMQHDHLFEASSDSTTVLTDLFKFAAPIPVLGRIAEHLVLKSYMKSFLQTRNRILKQVAESPQWQNFLPQSDEPKS